MVISIRIDEAILHAAEKLARETGSTPVAIMDQVLREGLGVATPDFPPLRNGLPQIRFDPSFEPTADAILDLLDQLRQNDNSSSFLIIPPEANEWVAQTAKTRGMAPGELLAGLVQESLYAQHKWPMRNGIPLLLRRSDDTTVVTPELIEHLQEEMDLEDMIG